MADQEHDNRIKSPFAFHPQMAEGGGCPGAAARQLKDKIETASSASAEPVGPVQSELGHWPVQLKLVAPQAPFLKDAEILICADCVPFAYPDFHQRYLSGRAVLVGCPKLDDLQYYYEKLKLIFAEARPKKILVLKMEVPCCNGIAQIAIKARNETAPEVDLEVQTVGIRGEVTVDALLMGTNENE